MKKQKSELPNDSQKDNVVVYIQGLCHWNIGLWLLNLGQCSPTSVW